MYPVTVIEEENKIQIGSWVYSVRKLKTIWKLAHDLGNMKVFINVPRVLASDLYELQKVLSEKF